MGTIRLSLLQQYAVGEIFIETGSMEGWTMNVAADYGFKTMYGIELAKKYYDYSIELQKDKNNIYFILGESPEVLPDLVKDLTSPATFWLDAHASGENIPGGKYGRCPLVQELEAIAQSPCKEHVLMIDDIRLCDTTELDHIKLTDIIEAIYKINPNYKIVYADGEEDGTFPNDILIATTHI